MADETYYSLLGISESASAAEIKAAFLRVIREVHPDRLANATAYWQRQAEEKTKEINEAYGVLSNREKRRLYDAQLAAYRGSQTTASGNAYAQAQTAYAAQQGAAQAQAHAQPAQPPTPPPALSIVDWVRYFIQAIASFSTRDKVAFLVTVTALFASIALAVATTSPSSSTQHQTTQQQATGSASPESASEKSAPHPETGLSASSDFLGIRLGQPIAESSVSRCDSPSGIECWTTHHGTYYIVEGFPLYAGARMRTDTDAKGRIIHAVADIPSRGVGVTLDEIKRDYGAPQTDDGETAAWKLDGGITIRISRHGLPAGNGCAEAYTDTWSPRSSPEENLLVPADDVSFTNSGLTSVRASSDGYYRLTGRLTNNSDHTVSGVRIRIQIFDCDDETPRCEIVADTLKDIGSVVPPGQARDIDQIIYLHDAPRFRGRFQWDFTISEIR
jgi:curved DNA-binding protein CbpA